MTDARGHIFGFAWDVTTPGDKSIGLDLCARYLTWEFGSQQTIFGADMNIRGSTSTVPRSGSPGEDRVRSSTGTFVAGGLRGPANVQSSGVRGSSYLHGGMAPVGNTQYFGRIPGGMIAPRSMVRFLPVFPASVSIPAIPHVATQAAPTCFADVNVVEEA